MNKKLLSFLLVLSFMLAIIMPAATLASGDDEDDGFTVFASTFVSDKSVNIAKRSGGVVHANFTIEARYSIDRLGCSTLYIQEKQDDGSWKVVKSIVSSYSYNTDFHSVTLSYNGTVGLQYKSGVSWNAKDGSTTESGTLTSAIVTASN